MTHDEHQQQLIAGYVLGDLSPEEEAELRRLLSEQPQLNREVERLREVLDLMPYALPEVEPSPYLRDAILDAASATNSPVRRLRRWPWGKIAGGITAAIALVLAFENAVLHRRLNYARSQIDRYRSELAIAQTQNRVIPVLQRPQTHVFSLLGTGETQTASGSLILDLDTGRAMLVFQNLPVPAADRIYRLWAIVEEEKILCSQFGTNAEGAVFDEFAIAHQACRAIDSTFAVTLERLTAPPQPAGPVVLLERS
jgi:anti-sigma-K factor RskA